MLVRHAGPPLACWPGQNETGRVVRRAGALQHSSGVARACAKGLGTTGSLNAPVTRSASTSSQLHKGVVARERGIRSASIGHVKTSVSRHEKGHVWHHCDGEMAVEEWCLSAGATCRRRNHLLDWPTCSMDRTGHAGRRQTINTRAG